MLPRREDGHMESYALEDMILDIQTRKYHEPDAESNKDPLELLKQREKDLVLAAELGKALLERNQELMRKSEAMTEEFAVKLEVCHLSYYIFPHEIYILN